MFSNFSWQMGQTLLMPLDASGTGMYRGLASFFARPGLDDELSADGTWSTSMASRDLSQSYAVLDTANASKASARTYIVIHVPAAVLASLLRFRKPLVSLEMPIHVSHLLLSTFLICLEASAALGTLRAQLLVQRGNQMWLESAKSQQTCIASRKQRAHCCFNAAASS